MKDKKKDKKKKNTNKEVKVVAQEQEITENPIETTDEEQKITQSPIETMDEEQEFDWGDYDLEDENIESDNPGSDIDPKESKLKRGLDIFGSLFALNVCFIVSILPIVTIGAAFTAMYAMMYRIQRHDDYTVVKEYFQEFRKNFKKGTIVWLIMILGGVILWGQYMYVCNFQDGMASLYSILLFIEGVLVVLAVPFVFPLLAYFDNTIANTFKNALLLAVSNLGAWLKIFVMWVAAFFFSMRYQFLFLSTWYLWLLIIFGVLCYASSVVAKHVFDRIMKTQKQKVNDSDSITMEEAMRRKKAEKKARKKKRFASDKSIKEHVAIMDVVNGKVPKDSEK